MGRDRRPAGDRRGGAVGALDSPSGRGRRLRIYGEGLLGTTAVTIGGVPAPDFRLVDGDLIIATVPPAGVPLTQNDGFAHVTVADDEGTRSTDLDADGVVDLSDCTAGCAAFGPELGTIFYTDATFTVSPSTGLDGGETTTATLTGHRANQGGWALVHLNPLGNFLEDGPLDEDASPPGPPYGAPLAFVPTTGNGNTAPTAVQVAAEREQCVRPLHGRGERLELLTRAGRRSVRTAPIRGWWRPCVPPTRSSCGS